MTEMLWSTLPEHWLSGQVKNVGGVVLGKMLQSKAAPNDLKQPYLRAANVQPEGELVVADPKSMWFRPSEVESLTLRRGDVVVVEGGQGGFGRAAFVEQDLDGWGFQNSINRIRPFGANDGRYIAYYLIALRASGFLRAYSNVVSMPHLTAEKLERVPLPIPPPAEQRAIADYLDRETAQIDTLIEEQKRLRELLAERRARAISTAVAEGIRSPTAMQPSGLMWAPQTPTHWPVAHLSRFASMRTGHTPSRSNPEYWVDCDIPWFTLADVWQLRSGRTTYLDETAASISQAGLDNSSAELLPPGTVLLSRTASVGYSGIMSRPMATSQDFWNWVPGPSLDSEYLLWVLRAMRPVFDSLMAGSTHKTIYQADAAALRIPVPPLEEQTEIAAHLRTAVSRLDSLADEAQRFVELSVERRAALITAAVTGQIDTRAPA